MYISDELIDTFIREDAVLCGTEEVVKYLIN